MSSTNIFSDPPNSPTPLKEYQSQTPDVIEEAYRKLKKQRQKERIECMLREEQDKLNALKQKEALKKNWQRNRSKQLIYDYNGQILPKVRPRRGDSLEGFVQMRYKIGIDQKKLSKRNLNRKADSEVICQLPKLTAAQQRNNDKAKAVNNSVIEISKNEEDQKNVDDFINQTSQYDSIIQNFSPSKGVIFTGNKGEVKKGINYSQCFNMNNPEQNKIITKQFYLQVLSQQGNYIRNPVQNMFSNNSFNLDNIISSNQPIKQIDIPNSSNSINKKNRSHSENNSFYISNLIEKDKSDSDFPYSQQNSNQILKIPQHVPQINQQARSRKNSRDISQSINYYQNQIYSQQVNNESDSINKLNISERMGYYAPINQYTKSENSQKNSRIEDPSYINKSMMNDKKIEKDQITILSARIKSLSRQRIISQEKFAFNTPSTNKMEKKKKQDIITVKDPLKLKLLLSDFININDIQ